MRVYFKSILSVICICISLQTVCAQTRIEWIPVNNGLEGDQIDVIWKSPNGTFFAGGLESHLFLSKGIGQDWISTTLAEANVGVMAVDSTGRILAGTSEGLFASTDEGLTWLKTELDAPVDQLLILAEGDIYAATPEGVVYFQQWGEGNWIQVDEISFDKKISPVKPYSVTVYQGRIRRSVNGGPWMELPEPNLDLYFYSAISDPSGSWICGGVGGGVYCSYDEGETWVSWNNGLENADVTSLFFSSRGELFAGSMQGFRFDSTFARWSAIDKYSPFDCAMNVYSFVEDKEGMLIATSNTRIIWRSKDGGITWEYVRGDTFYVPRDPSLAYPSNPCGTYYSKKYSGSYCENTGTGQSRMVTSGDYTYHVELGRSNDGFATIEEIDLPAPPIGSSFHSLRAIAQSGDSPIFLAARKQVLHFDEGQMVWQSVYDAGQDIKDLLVTRSGTLLLVTIEGIERSLDHGITWETVLDGHECIKNLETGPSGVIVADTKYISMDDGETWQYLIDQVPGIEIVSTFDQDGTLYAGTQGMGVFKTAKPLHSTLQEASYNTRFNVELYPNPASSITILSISLQEASEVIIEIYDMLGRKQQELKPVVLSLGNHDLSIDTGSLIPGGYMARVKVGNEQSNVPLTVIR